MRYWWVNQKQTYEHEVPGGYLWSPKRKRNGHMNPYYEFMREVSPGDLVFSFADACIKAVGVAKSHAYECPQPEEFGATGDRWNTIGWRVDVSFHERQTVFRPRDWMADLAPLLPPKYSPLRPNGHGVQNMYLARLPEPLALRLADLLGRDVAALARAATRGDEALLGSAAHESVLWEEHLRREIEANLELEETDRSALVIARRGQGRFRESVQQIEVRCRVTRVDEPEHLRASHSKPWRDSDNSERLDGENGLLLTPSIDHLFDRGFISFRDDGRLLVSPVAHEESLELMGVPTRRVLESGSFTRGQQAYLEYHRDEVFLKSRVKVAG
ncbi:MAG: HNH endonuclease [Planctomycetota bacterium]|nr:MAG: HNH endonuclease [Planctomycetota bacterium]